MNNSLCLNAGEMAFWLGLLSVVQKIKAGGVCVCVTVCVLG